MNSIFRVQNRTGRFMLIPISQPDEDFLCFCLLSHASLSLPLFLPRLLLCASLYNGWRSNIILAPSLTAPCQLTAAAHRQKWWPAKRCRYRNRCDGNLTRQRAEGDELLKCLCLKNQIFCNLNDRLK